MNTESSSVLQEPRGTRMERRKAHTRGLLLEAAADVMAERGFHDAKVQEIAAQADVGTGTVYNYFRSKDEIFAALIADTIEGLAAQLDAARDDAMSTRDRLWASWRAVLEYADAHRTRLRVFFGEGFGYHVFMQQAYGAFAADYEAELQVAIDAGRLRPCDTRLISAGMVGLASQVVSWWLDHPEVDLEEVADEIATFEWNGLRSASVATPEAPARPELDQSGTTGSRGA